MARSSQVNGGARKGKRPSPAPTARKRRPQLAPEEIDWKNFPSLRRFLSERGKIRSRRITGLSRAQQSQLSKAVKRARTMGLFPYPDQERNLRDKTAAGAPPRTERPPRDEHSSHEEHDAHGEHGADVEVMESAEN